MMTKTKLSVVKSTPVCSASTPASGQGCLVLKVVEPGVMKSTSKGCNVCSGGFQPTVKSEQYHVFGSIFGNEGKNDDKKRNTRNATTPSAPQPPPPARDTLNIAQ